ncbi:MAG: M1 family aminopeptidase [Spirochaetaceae bacterium]
MVKHLLYKLILLLLLISLFSCNKLRQIENIDVSKITIDFEIDESLRFYSGNMSFEYVNTTLSAINSAGFFLLPNETGGSLIISTVTADNWDIKYNTDKSVCTVLFDKKIPIGETVIINMEFSGTIPKVLESPGIFFSANGAIALGSFYPLPIPFNDEGSFDIVYAPDSGDVVESILSIFHVSFTATEDLQFAASGLVKKGKLRDNKRSFSVETGPVRDFFMVGSKNWGKVSKIINGIKITSWYPKGRMQQGIDALYSTEYSLKVFEDKLSPYPYNSMNIVSAPLGPLFGGMEYPGIIVLHDDYYTDKNSYGLEGTLAHEIGHQWFYNLVGNDPVMEPWLDETMTQYLTWLYFEAQYGSRAGNSVFASFNKRWSRIQRKPKALNLSADEYNGKEYGAILYGKGPLFLFALKAKFGDELFNQFLVDYINEFRWKRVTTEILQNYMFKYFAEEGDLMFRKWVYEEDNSAL